MGIVRVCMRDKTTQQEATRYTKCTFFSISRADGEYWWHLPYYPKENLQQSRDALFHEQAFGPQWPSGTDSPSFLLVCPVCFAEMIWG